MPTFQGVTQFTNTLDAQGIPYAVIGGIAVFAYGGERTTFDVDFLIDGHHKNKVRDIAHSLNFQIAHENEEVLQISGASQIDVIFANRPAARSMLARIRKIETLPFPVVAPEDLIGLKIQAFAGDRKREFIDKGDILTLMRNVPDLNFEQIKIYADVFGVWDEVCEIKNRI